MNIADIRKDYALKRLDETDVDADPFNQFHAWLREALAAEVPEPTAMTLATVDDEGSPSARIMLLKALYARGFVFYTNLESRKAREIAGNPRVALLFPWADMERQVRIEGAVERMGTAQALKYFLMRPRASQLAAWASAQSRPLSSRALLEDEFARLKHKFGEGRIPLPSFWGGYRVVPDAFEFWQGRPNRLHDRFSYTLADDGQWRIERLAP